MQNKLLMVPVYSEWNPPEVRVTSGQKLSTKIICIVLQTSVKKKIISSNTKRRKQMLNFVQNI